MSPPQAGRKGMFLCNQIETTIPQGKRKKMIPRGSGNRKDPILAGSMSRPNPGKGKRKLRLKSKASLIPGSGPDLPHFIGIKVTLQDPERGFQLVQAGEAEWSFEPARY